MLGFTGQQIRHFVIWAFATLVAAYVAGKVATAISKETE